MLPPPPPRKRIDYFFSYSDQYRSGSFDIRDVIRWQSEGDSYYKKYKIYFNDKSTVLLDPDEFYRFEKEFNKLSD